MSSQFAGETKEEFISSLVYPFLQFVLNSATAHKLKEQLEEQVSTVLTSVVLKADTIGKLRTEHKT